MSSENVYLNVVNDKNAADRVRHVINNRRSEARNASLEWVYRFNSSTLRNAATVGLLPDERKEAWEKILDHLFGDDGHYQEYVKLITKQETICEKKEETIMSVTVENKTLVNGEDVKQLSAQQLLISVKQLESEIKDLKSVEISSKYVDNKIKELEDTLKKVVKLLDAKA